MKVLPKDCIVIEDSLTGVIAARRAEMPCLAYSPDSVGESLKKEDAVVFRDMQDLPNILQISTT